MLRRLPLKARIIIGWIGVITAPFAVVAIALLGIHEKAAWAFYARALVLLGAWVYSIFLLRRMRREQRDLDAAERGE